MTARTFLSHRYMIDGAGFLIINREVLS